MAAAKSNKKKSENVNIETENTSENISDNISIEESFEEEIPDLRYPIQSAKPSRPSRRKRNPFESKEYQDGEF